jgi:WD40 repeat protein
MNFSFVSRMSIPIPTASGTSPIFQVPVLAFSADGSKFAMAMARGRVSVWDIRSKVPLKRFMEDTKFDYDVRHLQFSNGKLGKEVLVFVEVRLMFTF